MTEPTRILLVCTGNLCRSPMAEGILKDQLRRNGKDSLYQVHSAGTWTRDGLSASALAMEAMEEVGLDISSHRTHHLNGEDVAQASLVVVMERAHKEALLTEFPAAARKTVLLSELAGEVYDIFDPYGSDSLLVYRRCASEIENLLGEGYARLLELAGGKGGGA
jgi:protein-tyrosine phosphatase